LESLPKSVTNLNLASTNIKGNIMVFKDMQIKELNLYYCWNLIGNIKDLPQSITHLNLEFCRGLEGIDKAQKMFPNAKVEV